jgi:hypothetical protein
MFGDFMDFGVWPRRGGRRGLWNRRYGYQQTLWRSRRMLIQVSEFAMFSRREYIARLLTLPGLVGFAARGAAETGAKVTKAAAHYRDRPNNMQMAAPEV